MNILVEYLYRDSGNNKLWGGVVFSNKMDIDVCDLELCIRKSLIDGEFFVAKSVEVPSLRFDVYDEELDHGWHEYFGIRKTDVNPNDSLGRDICEFVEWLKLSGCSCS